MMPHGNADVFRLENNDPILRRYLNTAERAQVVAWQQPFMTWSLELHGGHLTGDPIYIRLAGNTDNQNVPKVDTRNHNAAEYNNLNAIANYQKLRKGLTDTQVTVLLTFIRANWASLTLIANRYANGQVAPPDPPPRAVTKACTTANCNGVVQIVAQGLAPCNVCYTYQ